MKRYLLFDSGCSLCTEVAKRVEEASDGWLEARSLREPEMQQLLDRAKPGWKWEPTLVEIDGDEVRVYQGVQMRVRMIGGLGVQKSWEIVRFIQDGEISQVNMDRRKFFGYVGGTLGSLLFLGLPVHRGPADRKKQIPEETGLKIPYLRDIAENARDIVMSSNKYQTIKQMVLSDGLHILDSRADLHYVGEENGKYVFWAPKNRQGVILQYVEGRLIGVVFIGTKNNGELNSGIRESLQGNGHIICGIVDVDKQKVISVAKIDVTSKDGNMTHLWWYDTGGRNMHAEIIGGDSHKIIVTDKNSGRRTEYVSTGNGVLVAQDSELDVSCGWACSVVCGLVGVVVCAVVSSLCGPAGAACGRVCGIVFVFVCATVCEWICN